ncbi:hypothetical protein CYMTET_29976 [Cymbomonas tetramitiformis]|uniref:Uncharacterized protein n=1 Tax=Cymbomonas tetramitiformis TaxID=36881 RepID=A0AAE0FKD3_9CHLO|nr:hypothetical protein CYMTET_29976 [Cymbomonas tetramitiformis]
MPDATSDEEDEDEGETVEILPEGTIVQDEKEEAVEEEGILAPLSFQFEQDEFGEGDGDAGGAKEVSASTGASLSRSQDINLGGLKARARNPAHVI